MAQDCDFQINEGIEWKIALRSSYKPCSSPKFSLMGSEWRLHLTSLDRSSYKIVVSLILESREGEGDTLQTPFEVVTYQRDPESASGTAVQDLKWHRVTKRSSVDFPIYYYNNIYEHCEVRIVFLFYGAHPSSDNLVEKSVQVSSEVPRDIESLSSDFSHLLEKEILPDVKLECGGRTLQAHRSVLAARSEIFRAMFQNGMLESETGAVKIPDVDVTVLEKLLKYVYIGKPEDISESNAADLYEAADKYAVHSLKAACAYWIARNLSVENCVKYLVVADSHSDQELKATTLSFILENPSLMKSEAWIAFSKELPLLAIDVLHAYVASTAQ